MIVQKDFLRKLRDFGLNAYEAKLWTALLSRGTSTAGELSDIANVPRSRSYDVLESLEKKGFILLKPGKPIRYVAVPPEDVLDRIKKKVVDEQEEKLKLINKINSGGLIKELKDLHEQGISLIEPTDLLGSIRNRDNIYDHMKVLVKRAQKSILIATTEQGLIRKAEVLGEELAQAKQRGVKIRISAPLSKVNSSYAKKLAKFADIKNTKTKSRFCVVDNKELMFMIMNDEDVHPGYDVAIWVTTPFFSKVIEDRFDEVWPKLKAIE